jgi:hypothetical protein
MDIKIREYRTEDARAACARLESTMILRFIWTKA